MSSLEILTKQVSLLTTAVNGMHTNAKQIDDLPPQTILNPNSLLHASLSGQSQKLSVQQIINDILNFKYNRLISIAGPITVTGNNIKIPAAVWVMENVNYQTFADTTINIPYAANGYTRTDIFVGDKFNQIIRIPGPETQGISPAPNVPVNTVYFTTVNVTDSTIGMPTEPIFTDVDWGNIGGNLSDQIDLINALNAKLNLGTYTGTASDLVLGKQIVNSIEKTTINDNDLVGIADSEDSSKTKFWKFLTIKNVFKTYFDTIYLGISNDQNVYGIKTFLNGKFALRNVANTFSSFFTNSNTSQRTYTLQDRSGVLLDDTDLSAINTSISGRQVKDDQIEISANNNVQNSWHGQTILFTSNCVITVPSSLNAGFGFMFFVMPSVTVTWAITSPHTWLATPVATLGDAAYGTTGHLMKRGNTNTIILSV